MKGHVSDQRLLAYLDGELEPTGRREVLRHVRACGRCSEELELLRSAGRRLSAALERLDTAPPWEGLPDRVRQALEARRRGTIPFPVERRVGSSASHPPSRRALATAAAILLLVAGGAAAAIPGSPVRVWVEHSVDAVTGLFAGTPAVDAAADSPVVPLARPGVAVEPLNGRVHVAILEPAEGVEVRVRVTDATVAAVSVREAGFRTGRGRIEVLAPAAGELLVEIPRSARSARVEVDGRPMLEKRGADLHLLVPAVDTAGSEVRFRLGPERP